MNEVAQVSQLIKTAAGFVGFIFYFFICKLEELINMQIVTSSFNAGVYPLVAVIFSFE